MNHPLSIAPMIDWSFGHFRVFMRLLAPHSLIYTEMQTTGAVINNSVKALSYSSFEHPIALQLGGSDPRVLADCARMAENVGYDEVNLNLGCPSDKVQAGKFGACLMREPAQVVDCIKAMREAVSIPVTAKTRIGIDYDDSYEYFREFAYQLINAGADKLVVHARKAWLNGLNPKQNRTIPPVNYDYVYRFKQEFPDVPVVINGNITDPKEIDTHLNQVDGVMLGRLACDNPYKIAVIHHHLHPEFPLLKRSELVAKYLPYLQTEFEKGASLNLLIKPIFNLLHGVMGTSQWKKDLMLVLQTKDTKHLNELHHKLIEMELQ